MSSFFSVAKKLSASALRRSQGVSLPWLLAKPGRGVAPLADANAGARKRGQSVPMRTWAVILAQLWSGARVGLACPTLLTFTALTRALHVKPLQSFPEAGLIARGMAVAR
jgi:hypothetical protein